MRISERRLARLLAAFIASGLVFPVAPGTLMGVWNLIGIRSSRSRRFPSLATGFCWGWHCGITSAATWRAHSRRSGASEDNQG